MSKNSVAKRYAVALFKIAEEKNALEQIQSELEIVKQVFNENKDVLPTLKHPKITGEQKRSLINNSFKGFSTEVTNTLLVIVDRRREEVISDFVDEFLILSNEAQGIAAADVYSVRELTDEEKTSISEMFTKRLGKKTLKIKNIVDPSLLGGIKLRIGNTIYDGSVIGKLERIERQLVSAKG